MNTTNNMLLNYKIINSKIKNNRFEILDEMFKKHGWYMRKNELNWINYTTICEETSSFDIQITPHKIFVSIPLNNSIYQFVTTFNNYNEAIVYIEQKLLDYIIKKN